MSNTGFVFSPDNQELHIKIIGPVDENTNYPGLPEGNFSTVKLDLTQFRACNSIGLKTWISFVEDLSEIENLFVSNIPALFVHQMNNVSGMLPKHSTIQSIELPYFCETCNQVRSLQHSYANRKPIEKFPSHSCSDCESKVVPDVVESVYLKFQDNFKI